MTFIPHTPAFAKDADIEQPMTFELAWNGGSCLGCTWIAAKGVITDNTPQAFDAFMKDNPEKLTVFLNSGGGSLSAGMELGRLFRKHHLNTSVGDTIEQDGWSDTKDGVCASACA